LMELHYAWHEFKGAHFSGDEGDDDMIDHHHP